MPASSEKQKNYMKMALAVKHGKKLKGLNKGTMAKLRETAEGMSEASLHDFTRAAVRKKQG